MNHENRTWRTGSINRLAGRRWPAFVLLLWPIAGTAQAPILQPGAPGEPVRELSAEEALDISDSSYSPADIRFLEDMIPHHHQALEMAALAPTRTNTPALRDLGGRIDLSQADEIAFMQAWLSKRGKSVPSSTAHGDMHTSHKMAGMASPEQMAALAAARGTDFDRLFLELMIAHHDGALKMVDALLDEEGSAYDPALFEFTTDVKVDQAAEIGRMNALLVSLSTDPRAGLAPGFSDAGQAISNLALIATLGKPPGFYDPDNPGELPQKGHGRTDGADTADGAAADEQEPADDEPRYPFLSFANTDMAFAGDILVTGSYHGFNIYRLDADGIPVLASSVVCPGGQGDVSIVGHLLIMSVEQVRGRVDCGLGGVTDDVSPERFVGLRIFDISDVTRPVQVGAVQTCRGSHTHSVVSGPDDDGRIIVYNSGLRDVRDEKELPGCIDELPGDDRTALFRIDVIAIPVNDPAAARIVDSPAVFADPNEGTLAGLWRGGDHGEDTQETSVTDHCHDITVFPERNLAAGACSGNGIIFDVTDPLNPQRIDEAVDKGFAYWHSATFNNDGTKVVFTDEWGGGDRARCRAHDPLDWGADAFYEIVDGQLEFRAHYKMPAPQVEEENCVAHNASIVPVPGRDILVQAWYQGGISVVDFSDTEKPVEIAFFDRGPIDAEELVPGGYWSAYWYGGRIYGTEIVRGLDIFRLLPSEYLSENEIAAAALADQGGVFNPQQQFRVTWPDDPVVALAYLDQLERNDALSSSQATTLRETLEAAAHKLAHGGQDEFLARQIDSLAQALKEGADPARRRALADTLTGIARRVRAR